MIVLRTLGESLVEVGAVRIGPSAPHMFAALLYLGIERGRRVPRVTLQDLLFPGMGDRAASHSLRQLLYRLRRAGVRVETDATSVLLPADRVAADYDQLLAPTPGERRTLGALAGGFLSGFSPTFSHPFAEWLDQRRSEILAAIRRTLTTELLDHRRAERWPLADQTARAILSLDPLNEEATLTLAEAIALSGAKVEALQLLDAYLQEVGSANSALRVPATVLRRRIAERLPVNPAPASTQFVGRTEPTALLRDLLGRARLGEGGACHIWGEAGIGKTRLVTEFSRAAILKGVRVEQVSSQPHDVRRPMGAFTDLVPALLRLPGALGCSPEAVAFLSKLFRYDGGNPAALSPDVREAELLSANITHAISELLDALTAESTILVVVEDAQWLDPISLRVFADLVGERKRRSLLLLFTSREPQLGIAAPQSLRFASVRLSPLSVDESRALLEELLQRAATPADDELLEWSLAVAAGNPLFLHSLAAHYVATRDRRGIPEPLNALLAERLNVLDRRARRIFEACAVLGRHAKLERLRLVLGMPTFELLDGLQTLEDHGFIRSEGARISTSHMLLSEIALSRAAPSVRTLLHRDAARVLRDEPITDASATLLWDCAEHWLQAGDSGEAVIALRACARHAMEIGRPHDACDLLARAAGLAEAPEDRMVVLEELIRAARVAEQWTVVGDSIATYRQIAAQSGHVIGRYHELRVLELEARLWGGDDPGTLLQAYRDYLHDPNAPDAIRLAAANAVMRMAEELLSVSLGAEAFDAVRGIAECPELEADRFRLRLLYALMCGRYDEAIAMSRRATVEIRGSAADVCRMLWLAGFGLARAGRVEAGCAALEATFHKARAARLRSREFSSALALACVLRDAGRGDEAFIWHERASALAERGVCERQSLNHFSNGVLFALDRRDCADARRWLARASEIPASRSGYPRLIFLALEIRVRQLEHSYDCSDDELRDLLDGHFRARNLGHHDEVMVTLWHALARKDRTEYADDLLRAYLTEFRQLRWPLCPELRELAERVAPEREQAPMSAVA